MKQINKNISNVAKKTGYSKWVILFLASHFKVDENDADFEKKISVYIDSCLSDNSRDLFSLAEIAVTWKIPRDSVLKSAICCGKQISKNSHGSYCIVGNGILTLADILKDKMEDDEDMEVEENEPVNEPEQLENQDLKGEEIMEEEKVIAVANDQSVLETETSAVRKRRGRPRKSEAATPVQENQRTQESAPESGVSGDSKTSESEPMNIKKPAQKGSLKGEKSETAKQDKISSLDDVRFLRSFAVKSGHKSLLEIAFMSDNDIVELFKGMELVYIRKYGEDKETLFAVPEASMEFLYSESVLRVVNTDEI